jgi:hypothetical protein
MSWLGLLLLTLGQSLWLLPTCIILAGGGCDGGGRSGGGDASHP